MSVPVNYGPMTEIQMYQPEIDEVVARICEMPDDGLMVEWGSGGSTIKWLETMQGNQKLITIEHNPDWHMRVRGYLNTRADLKQRANYIFKGELYGYQHGYASVLEEHPHGLDDYLLPTPEIANADIFFIDGIGRATCSLLVKFISTKADPVIYIHDYYGREQWYTWATQFFPKKERVGNATLVRLWK
jgi:hypothetical protein